MTDLTVLGEFVYTAVAIISWVGVAAVACSMVLVILFASMPAFDWLLTTSEKSGAGTRETAADHAIKQAATSPITLRSLQQFEDPEEDVSAQTEEKRPSNVYSDIYSTPLGSYVLPC